MDDLSHFSVSATIIKQLGEQLVSDEVTAIIELVKNAYDADARYVKISVETNEMPKEKGLYFSSKKKLQRSRGMIVIEDNGIGMTESEINKGWLRISYSQKRNLLREGKLTPKYNRTPLGEKGLGRLSTQRLGSRLELFTHKEHIKVENLELQKEIDQENANRIEHHIAFDWSDFSSDADITSVPVYFRSESKVKNQKGTRLIISNLLEPKVWENKITQGELIKRLSQLIFPFEKVRPFNIYLTINGVRINLDSISDNLRNLAVSRFSIKFDEKKVTITGRIRLNRLRGMGKLKSEIYDQYVSPDQGLSFFSFLTDSRNKYRIDNLSYLGKDGWFACFTEERDFISLGELSQVEESTSGSAITANPGPFYGEIDEFFLRGINTNNVFSKLSEYQDYVKKHSGIRIFRDGFGIRPYGLEGYDWLNLGGSQTSGLSYYGLRPNNVIGYIEITAKANNKLQEKTDREGFVNSPYSRNFFFVIGQLVNVLDKFFNNLGRSLNDFRKQQAESIITTESYEEQFEELRRVSQDAIVVEKRAEEFKSGIEQVTESIEKTVDRVQNTPLLASKAELDVQQLLISTQKKLQEARDLISQLQTLLSNAKQLKFVADSLEPKIDILEEQMAQFSELASLGLIAEALTHELHNIADRLAEETRKISTSLRNKGIVDADLVTYIEYIHSAITALRKQLNHLAPSLRYLRESHDNLMTQGFFSEVQEFYTTGRFQNSGIKVILEKPFNNFSFKINKGKITQIIDNLFLNSEYWLEDGVRKGLVKKPAIFVKSIKPYIQIYDNGIGIDPYIEGSLFQPFVTTKPKSVGRGLGLFIVSELLESSNCEIELLPERNSYGRKFIFQIELTGVLDDK